MMQQPEAYIGGGLGLFDAEGQLIKDDIRPFLASFLDAFAAWVERCLRP
jgi:chromate reductase